MKAAVYLGPKQIEIREVPTPEPKPGEVLLRVKSCSVCGTDVRIYNQGQKNVVPPRITGHEIAGVVAKVGRDVAGGLREGDKATVVTCVGCQACAFCKRGIYNLCDNPRYIGYFFDGGFAEYMIVPEEAVRGNNVVRVDAAIDFPEISMVEPLSCCINGQEFLRIEAGETVVIFGAGPIGCMHAELAKAAGATTIIVLDPVPNRLEGSRGFGATHTINPKEGDPVQKVMELTGGRGGDVVIAAAGVTAVMEQAIQCVAKRGRVSLFASVPKDNPFLKVDANIIHYKEAGVFGVFASYRKQYERALELIASGKVNAKKFVTHRLPLDGLVDAIRNTQTGVGLKSVLEM